MSPTPPIDTVERIRLVLDLDPDSLFIEYDQRWMRRGMARETVERLRAKFAQVGLPPGTEIGVIARNRPSVLSAILAVLLERHCVVPLSPMQDGHRMAEELRQLNLSLLLGSEEDWLRPEVRQVCEQLGMFGMSLSHDGSLVEEHAHLRPGARQLSRRDGVAVLMMTSGTTGPPKRIEITYADLDSGFGRASQYSRASSTSMTTASVRNGKALVSVPITHIGGLWNSLSAIIEGRPMALLDRFEPNAWSSAVERHQIVTTSVPPTGLRMILDADVPSERLASLRAIISGTAPLDPALEDEFAERYGIPVLATYGATEFPGGVVGWTLDLKREFGLSKRGSVGRARPGVQVRVIDPDSGLEAVAGREGVLEIRTAQTERRPQAVGGWVRCTDMGRLDDDGFLWITGRTDDAIIRGGFKIVPVVVESMLEQNPAVRHAAVVGMPDRRLGAVPVAVVELSQPVSEEELRRWVRGKLLAYQVPTEILIVDQIPRTPSMKPSKPKIRELIEGAHQMALSISAAEVSPEEDGTV